MKHTLKVLIKNWTQHQDLENVCKMYERSNKSVVLFIQLNVAIDKKAVKTYTVTVKA